MILPDVNLLVYAVDQSSMFHESANPWWNEVLSSAQTVGLCYPSMLGFIRLVTSRRVFAQPLGIEDATGLVTSWLEQPNVTIVIPTTRHWSLLTGLLNSAGTGGNLTTDAHIAALAVEHGYTVYSNDNDFGRFQAVRWINPLAGC